MLKAVIPLYIGFFRVLTVLPRFPGFKGLSEYRRKRLETVFPVFPVSELYRFSGFFQKSEFLEIRICAYSRIRGFNELNAFIILFVTGCPVFGTISAEIICFFVCYGVSGFDGISPR